MPILDHASDFSWFAMPRADATLSDLLASLDDDEIERMVEQIASGLEAAHVHGLVHRDVTPRNILRMPDDARGRWVVADWGLVRRAPGMTSTVRTRPGEPFGTDGFVAPEMIGLGHAADGRVDVYGLGRVLGYALTKEWPRPNLPQLVTGRWRHFVQRATHLDPKRRIQSMPEFLREFRERRDPASDVPAQDPGVLLQAAIDGDQDAADALLDAALAAPGDGDLWLDCIGALPREAVQHLVLHRSADVQPVLGLPQWAPAEQLGEPELQ
jgi:serine/threonine protein kinase